MRGEAAQSHTEAPVSEDDAVLVCACAVSGAEQVWFQAWPHKTEQIVVTQICAQMHSPIFMRGTEVVS